MKKAISIGILLVQINYIYGSSQTRMTPVVRTKVSATESHPLTVKPKELSEFDVQRQDLITSSKSLASPSVIPLKAAVEQKITPAKTSGKKESDTIATELLESEGPGLNLNTAPLTGQPAAKGTQQIRETLPTSDSISITQKKEIDTTEKDPVESENSPITSDATPVETAKAPRKFLSYFFRPAKPVEIKKSEITKTEIEKIKDTDTLSLQDFNYTKDFMREFRKSGLENKILQEHNDTLAASYEASLPDTQAINHRIRNFDRATRNVSKALLTQIKKLESQNELTFAQKREIADSLIQSQLNTVFGTDSITGQNKISFQDALKKELVDAILKKTDLFDTTQSDIVRLQTIAKCSDTVMNKIGQGQPLNTTFSTTIDSQGTYITSIKSSTEGGKSIETRSMINNEGTLIGRTLIVDNQDGQGPVTFMTTINATTGTSISSKILENAERPEKLTSAESKMTNLQFALFQSMILGKFMLKVSLWSTKQIAWSLLNHPIPTPILLGSVIPLAVFVKSSANLAGYEQSDPTIVATFGTVVDMTMGNRRAILSNKPTEVFTKGSTIANAINTINPFKKEGGYEVDPNAEYFGAEAELGKAIMFGVKKILPDTFGERLVSPDNLKKSQEIAKDPKKSDTTKKALDKKSVAEPSQQVAQESVQPQDAQKTVQKLNATGLQLAQGIVNKIFLKSTILVKNKNVLGSSAASLLTDTNATIKRLSQLDTKTRDTAQTVLKMLDSGMFKQFISQTVSKTVLSKLHETDIAQHKQAVAEKLIQSQIDNVFGVNQLSGQSIYKLTPEVQKELELLIINKDALFKPETSKIDKLRIIAEMSDVIMNKLACDLDGSSPVAKFTTTILDNGSYKTTIVDDAGMSSTTTVDRSGKITEKVLTVADEHQQPTIIFTTKIDSGKTTTYLDTDSGKTKILTEQDATLVDMIGEQVKNMANARSMIKATLWTGKQIVLCAIPMPVTLATSLIITAISPIIIKGGSMAMGYKFSDPVIRTAVMTAMELTMGNSRGFLSANPNRVFSKGTIGSKIATSITTGKIKESFAEKRDPNEEYYHSLDDAMITASFDAYNWFFSTKTLIAAKDLPTQRVGVS